MKFFQNIAFKWFVYLFIAIVLNFAVVYFLTKSNNNQSTQVLQIALQNQNASVEAENEQQKSLIGAFNSKQQAQVKNQTNKKAKKDDKKSKTQSQIVYKANVKNNAELNYPTSALRRGIEGKVILHILVNKEGKTEEVKTISSSGFSILDKAAVKSVKNWNFTPIDVKEKNVDLIWVEVAIEYKINTN